MTRRSRLTLLAVAALAAATATTTAGAQGTGERLVPLDRSTPVREYDGHLLFSRWDGAAFRLSTYVRGTVRDLPVRARSAPFDADVGPDSSGKPSAVVSLCDATCDLFVLGFEEGDQLRPVRNANTSDRDETDPSVWRGRLTFAREYGAQIVPYTKRLVAPRSRPSSRLASLPDERCGTVDPPDCRPIENADLVQMELWGDRIGQSWTYQPDDFPGFRQNEIRLTDVERTDTRQVAAMTSGLGGQTFLGPSFADGRLGFFRACQGDPGGCSTQSSGAIRYRISTGGYEIDGANEAWSAWALGTGDAGYHVPSAFDCSGDDAGAPPSEPCGIYATDLSWQPLDEERVR